MNTWFAYFQSGNSIRVRTALVTRTGDEVNVPRDADWTDRGVAISAGGSGSWDVRLTGALSPCTVVKKNGTYFLYYIGADGNRKSDGGPRHRALGVATSPDGINFTKHGRILTYLPHNNEEEGIFSAGAFLDTNGEVVMYYSALDAGSSTSTSVDSDVRLATSSNGLNFADKGDVLSHVDSRVWGYGDELFPVGAFREGSTYYVYYIAQGIGTYWDLALAQGPARNNIAGNTQQALDAGAAAIKSGCPMRLSASKIVVSLCRPATTEQRTAPISAPQSLSPPVQTYSTRTGGVYLDVAPLPPPLPPPPLEEDHLGANWIISADTKIAGKHTNVGLFKVNPGVTAVVEAYNGSRYGTLEVHATDIDIGGNIIASGKGYGGGGGGAGSGSNYKDCPGAPNGAPGNGVAGGSNGGNAEGCPGFQCTGGGGKGGKGGGSYGGGGGAGGDNNVCDYHPGAHGSSGRKGGYAKAEGQGDVTTDESLRLGSGGGAGGGGQAAGGRSSIDMYGGGGGGGAGNRGGGWIKLYATASIAISGNIHAKGLDNSAGNGAGGGCGAKENRGGNGGNAAVAGGSNGGTGGSCKGGQTGVYPGGNGGEGVWGAGGGILLKCAIDSAISITGTIDNRGGGNSPDNGGTVKIFYAVTAPSIARIYTGRLYTKSIPVIPTYTEKTTTHTCGAKIAYQVSPVAIENVDLTCPYDNLSLGVKGVKETVTITNTEDMAAKLASEIAALDNRIAELLGQIEALRDEIANTKAILGV